MGSVASMWCESWVYAYWGVGSWFYVVLNLEKYLASSYAVATICNFERMVDMVNPNSNVRFSDIVKVHSNWSKYIQKESISVGKPLGFGLDQIGKYLYPRSVDIKFDIKSWENQKHLYSHYFNYFIDIYKGWGDNYRK